MCESMCKVCVNVCVRASVLVYLNMYISMYMCALCTCVHLSVGCFDFPHEQSGMANHLNRFEINLLNVSCCEYY